MKDNYFTAIFETECESLFYGPPFLEDVSTP